MTAQPEPSGGGNPFVALQAAVEDAGGEWTPTSLKLGREMGIDAWARLVAALVRVESVVQLALGDALVYAKEVLRLRPAQIDAALKAAGVNLEAHTLDNYKWVASSIPPGSRRRDLAYSHHVEVAGLRPVERDRLLKDADDGKWTVRRLRQERNERRATPSVVTVRTSDPSRRHRTILADPPWDVKFGTRPPPYPTMGIQQIAALRVPAADDAHLYLWTTNQFLREAFDVVEAWGFQYSTTLVWCKPPMGIALGGTYRNATEFVLFARRGNLTATSLVERNWWLWKRRGHSVKPEEFFDIVEQVSPGPYLELFARRRRARPGWDTWGDEAPVTRQAEDGGV